MTKFLEAESLDDFVNQGLETKKDEVVKEKFDMSWNYILLKKFWRRKKKDRMAHMGDVRILWDWMGDVRKMERLEKHLCLGFLFGKTMKRIWNISGRDTLGYSEEEELYTVRFTQQYVQCQF